ncbi:MAG: RagB/SusD family nutrient uptake outer membrane protein [Bacteroidales bacterium]|nr:RagB/SusD family nutrient uptake outer membrane protein [Bacteroidales bacterium]
MKNLLILAAIVIVCTSCSDDILDITAKDRIADDAVWNDENLIRAYSNSLYNAIPHGFYIHMFSKYTDEAYNSSPTGWGAGTLVSGYTADNITNVGEGDYWGGYLYYWNRGYEYIRKINVFLQKMDETSFEFEDKDKLVGEAKFLRAFIYFNLIERFGGVPIVNQPYDLGEVTFTRNTFDECVAFIEQDLDEAMAVLPEKYLSTDANFGRGTQDACKALRSRVLLYAASPLFNPANDLNKWQKAAEAAEALLNSDYTLYPDYREAFMMPGGSENNELIFTRNFTVTNGHQAPLHNLNRRYGAYGGWWGSNGPSQNLVDDYDMVNGEPPFIYVNGEKTLNPASGYDPDHPWKNRDPRFEATVTHNLTIYHGDTMQMWVASDGKTWGFDSYKQSGDNPRTNYVLKKFMPGDDVVISWQEFYTNPWIYFRLGEIYLNYAEAMFELGDEDVCREYLSKIRERVGMPPIPSNVSGEELRKRLYNERRIELAFESHRYFDVRRWKIAMEVENKPIMGMDVILNINTGDTIYREVQLLERTFEERMYLLPIATDEINKNEGSIEQNPEW